MIYVKEDEYELLLEILKLVCSVGDEGLIKRYEDFIIRIAEEREKAKTRGRESMRKYRKNNPEKVKEKQRLYMRTYRKENK